MSGGKPAGFQPLVDGEEELGAILAPLDRASRVPRCRRRPFQSSIQT
jgi:hypothetical protein